MSLASLRTQLASLVAAAGLDAARFDPVAAAFRADDPAWRHVLRRAVVGQEVEGMHSLAVYNRSQLALLPGVWSYVITTGDGSQAGAGGGWSGDTVPAGAQELALRTAADVADALTEFDGGFRVFDGNTVAVSGPETRYTLAILDFEYSDYRDCGACGVGSTVTFTVRMDLTFTGTLNGATLSPEPRSLVHHYTWRREG